MRLQDSQGRRLDDEPLVEHGRPLHGWRIRDALPQASASAALAVECADRKLGDFCVRGRAMEAEMTRDELRQWAMIYAMQGILSNPDTDTTKLTPIIGLAVAYANALVEAEAQP